MAKLAISVPGITRRLAHILSSLNGQIKPKPASKAKERNMETNPMKKADIRLGKTFGPKSPIQHVVIIVKENHAFDNYFGKFPGANGDATLAPAPNPPLSDHPHTHEAWLARANYSGECATPSAAVPAPFFVPQRHG